ncbi:TIGR02678 family protein [Actinacidiphila glaucinigra]|uniref:TIGR02678 family protein n=1 Tax=Actinacidiphila glaucinigra TaxID=235986 RepID=UPI003D8C0737
MPSLDRTLDAEIRAGRSRAVRVLLRRPMLTDVDAGGDFLLVRTHAQWLQRFFNEMCGWPLTVDARRGFARLRKVTALADEFRPAMTDRADSRPFNLRRYVLLCVLCAALQSSGVQTTLQELARKAADLTSGDDVLETFDAGSQAERRALVDATRMLLQIGVLVRQDSEGDYVGSGEGDTLFNVDLRRLAQVPVTPRPPSASASLDEMLHEDRYGPLATDEYRVTAAEAVTKEQRMMRLRHGIMRRLLDNPVLYFASLGDEELAYLESAESLLRENVELAGFRLERRREGWLAVDPEGLSTDVVFPGPDSTVKHAALLFADELSDAARAQQRYDLRITRNEAVAFIEGLLERFPTWARTYQTAKSGPVRLTKEMLALLSSMGLVLVDGDTVCVQPAIARFSATLTA